MNTKRWFFLLSFSCVVVGMDQKKPRKRVKKRIKKPLTRSAFKNGWKSLPFHLKLKIIKEAFPIDQYLEPRHSTISFKKGKDNWISLIRFNTDGSKLIVADGKNNIRTYSLKRERWRKGKFKCPGKIIKTLSNDGSMAAVLTEPKKIAIFKVGSSKPMQEFPYYMGVYKETCCFNSNHTQFALWGLREAEEVDHDISENRTDYCIKLFDIATKAILKQINNVNFIRQVSFNHDDSQLYALAMQGAQLYRFKTRTGESLPTKNTYGTFHNRTFCFNREGSKIALGGHGAYIHDIDLDENKRPKLLFEPAESMCFSPDGSELAVTYGKNVMRYHLNQPPEGYEQINEECDPENNIERLMVLFAGLHLGLEQEGKKYKPCSKQEGIGLNNFRKKLNENNQSILCQVVNLQ